MARSRRFRRIPWGRQPGRLLGLGALLGLLPVPVLAQGSDLPADAVYLAATDSLLTLSPGALLDTWVCDRNWRKMYDLAIRCGQTGVARRVLLPVAEELEVPLESGPRACAAARESRSLQLSPVQFESSSSAWFVAAVACAGPDGPPVELRIFGFRLQDGTWILDRVESLPDATT